MASEHSGAALSDLKKRSNSSPRTELVFAARTLELHTTSIAAAAAFLDLLPKYEFDPDADDPVSTAWLDVVGLQDCASGGISDRELEALFALQYHLPRLLAKAVLISPRKLPDLLARTQLFITPDSDFTIQLQPVCRRQHKGFLDAVAKLPAKDKQWFVSAIFNPTSCRAIFLPEQ
jgi:hypothetical protein